MATALNKIKKIHPALISLVVLSVILGPAQPMQAAGQDKQVEPAKQDGGEKSPSQDKQGRADPGNTEGPAKEVNAAKMTVTVLNEQQVPLRDAVVILFATETQSREQKSTGGDGKVAFQIHQGQMTLRITADHMVPIQMPLPSTSNPRDSVLEVVMTRAN